MSEPPPTRAQAASSSLTDRFSKMFAPPELYDPQKRKEWRLESERDQRGPDVIELNVQHIGGLEGAASADYGKGKAGFYRAVIADGRVSGPILITHTKNDQAVGVAYPLASRIASQIAAALGDENDPYGGLGRNGAQHTTEADGHGVVMGGTKTAYDFAPGAVNNLRADSIIKDHGDVRSEAVAYAVLCRTAGI